MLQQNNQVQVMAEIAVLTALGLALDFFAGLFFNGFFIYGGSVSIAMLPIMIISYRRGVLPGLITGFLVGFLQLIFGGYLLEFFQMILDYPVPFMVVGFAGIFSRKNPTTKSIISGGILAGLLRYFSHFLAGVTFWRAYVPTDPFLGIEGFNAFTWSLFYNGLYMLPSIILSVLFAVILYQVAPQLFKVDDNQTEANFNFDN